VASRIGSAQAREAAMLLLTLRGTPTIYRGEEIGMTDSPIASPLVHDPWEKNVPGFGLGRDPVRTPMQWTPERHAGFTSGEPWLPIGPAVEALNVRTQRSDPKSTLSLYRGLIRLRRSDNVITLGSYRLRSATQHGLVYERRHFDGAILLALNLTNEAQEVLVPGRPAGSSTFDLSRRSRLSGWRSRSRRRR
jgi:alpha-glucosidase